MPSPHPTFHLRVPQPIFDRLKTRSDELGMTAQSYVIALLAAEFGFGRTDNDDAVAALLARHDRERGQR